MLKVNIIGMGPGCPDLLTQQAVKAIAASNLLLGDKRLLEPYAAQHIKCLATTKVDEVLAILSKLTSQEMVSILVSGDVGFFSLAKTLEQKLAGCEVKRLPGISSLVYFAAQLHMPWEDAKVISRHGRNNNLVQAVQENSKVFVLAGGKNNASTLCTELLEAGLGQVEVFVGENLSYQQEKITTGTAEELAKKNFSPLSVLFILNNRMQAVVQNAIGIADKEFIRAKVPMTKEEVRIISLAKLKVTTAATVYDIGAGTGSCSVELARQAREGCVYALEKNPQALELLQQNKAKFACRNLTIVPGAAEDNIAALPAADYAFIGGSGGQLERLLDILYAKNPVVRVVINAITLETLEQTVAYYRKKAGYQLSIINVTISRSKEAGTYHMMLAENPVYILTAEKKNYENL